VLQYTSWEFIPGFIQGDIQNYMFYKPPPCESWCPPYASCLNGQCQLTQWLCIPDLDQCYQTDGWTIIPGFIYETTLTYFASLGEPDLHIQSATLAQLGGNSRLTTLAVEHKEEKKKTSEDIVGLNWEGSILALRLTAPDGTVIPGGFNNSSIRNIKGSNYEYYILKDVMPGNWTVEVVPIEVPTEGENFMLIKGPNSETKDMQTTDLPTKDEPRLTTMAAKTLLEKYQDSWIHGLTNAGLQSLLRSF
jgi:hypothetical protein